MEYGWECGSVGIWMRIKMWNVDVGVNVGGNVEMDVWECGCRWGLLH